MSDIDLSGAVNSLLEMYCGLILLFAAVGSFGLYKMLAKRRNAAPVTIALISFVLVGLVGVFAFMPFYYVIGVYSVFVGPVLLLVYMVFGLTAWATGTR